MRWTQNRLRQLYGLAGQHVDAVEEQVAANGCRPAIAQVLTIEDFEPVNVRTWLELCPGEVEVSQSAVSASKRVPEMRVFGIWGRNGSPDDVPSWVELLDEPRGGVALAKRRVARCRLSLVGGVFTPGRFNGFTEKHEFADAERCHQWRG